MGQLFTRNLLLKEFPVVLHNRSAGAIHNLVGEGAVDGQSPNGAVAQPDVVIISLPAPAAVFRD